MHRRAIFLLFCHVANRRINRANQTERYLHSAKIPTHFSRQLENEMIDAGYCSPLALSGTISPKFTCSPNSIAMTSPMRENTIENASGNPTYRPPQTRDFILCALYSFSADDVSPRRWQLPYKCRNGSQMRCRPAI